MFRAIFVLFLSLIVSIVWAEEINPQPLPAEQAFEFSTHVDQKNQLILEWHIAKDYYLYRDKLRVVLNPASEIQIEQIKLPAGKTKKDEFNASYQVYSGDLIIPVKPIKPINGILKLDVNYQGCSAKGFCYPPVKKDIRCDLMATKNTKNVVITSEIPKKNEKGYVESIFDESSDIAIIITFLGIGLLLSFTPCVLPMIPILSGIIVGHKHLTTWKAFLLSLVYVLGMALTYAAAGIIVALIGSRIQTFFQTPWVIVIGSGLFIFLALSLFGYYELELPRWWQKEMTAISNRQKGGTYVGSFLMGALSSLMVSPCVTAPLVGVLAYIADTGDTLLGGFALLALGMGMGMPLLLLGASAGKWLPKAGPWMESIKKFFGILLLGVAIVLLSRILPGPVILFFWAVLLICSAMFLGVFNPAKKNWNKVLRGLGLVFLIYGIILIIGSVTGNSDPLRPWVGAKMIASERPSFVIVKNMTQLNDELAAAKREHKPVVLDFYADWCTACISMDRYVFSKPAIQALLMGYVVLRADVTSNNEFDRDLLKRFNVIAPPTILFFDSKGRELLDKRIVGEVDAKEFIKHIELDLVSTVTAKNEGKNSAKL